MNLLPYHRTVQAWAYNLMARHHLWDMEDDIRASANLGLCEAGGRYDGRKGNGFMTYAWHVVHGAMYDQIGTERWVKPTRAGRIPPIMVGLEEAENNEANDRPVDESVEISMLKNLMRRVASGCPNPTPYVIQQWLGGWYEAEIARELGVSGAYISQLIGKCCSQVRIILKLQGR